MRNGSNRNRYYKMCCIAITRVSQFCCRGQRQHTGNQHSGQTLTEIRLTYWTLCLTSVSCLSYGGLGGPSTQVSTYVAPL